MEIVWREGVALIIYVALEQASSRARAAGASAVLSLSCDLPFLAADDLCTLITVAQKPNAVTTACDRAGTGTNALLISALGTIPYLCGPDSFARHCEAAKDQAVSPPCALDL